MTIEKTSASLLALMTDRQKNMNLYLEAWKMNAAFHAKGLVGNIEIPRSALLGINTADGDIVDNITTSINSINGE